MEKQIYFTDSLTIYLFIRRTIMRKIVVLNLSAFLFVFALASNVFAQQISISGKLAPTVEAGGWLIVDSNQKFLLLNASRYKSESWFREGTEVNATGEVKRGVMTIYQEGTPFEAGILRPIQNPNSGNSNFSNSGNLTTVTVTGDARVLAQPDTAIISISVVTQNNSAVQAQQQNASQTNSVLNALKIAAGNDAEIKTSGYSLIPQRVYRENQPPTITGYEARNNITVTLSNLNRVGAIIDAAGKAGANNIDGISFTLRNDRDVRGRALTEAAREALAKANTLASALGGRVVRITAVQESGANPHPVMYAQREALSATADTPIQVGALEINSQVQLIAEVETGSNPR